MVDQYLLNLNKQIKPQMRQQQAAELQVDVQLESAKVTFGQRIKRIQNPSSNLNQFLLQVKDRFPELRAMQFNGP